MPHLPWLDHYHRELERRGVPRSFRKRFLEELQDHLIDLTEEITMAENMPHDQLSRAVAGRLGAPEHVAEATAAEYSRSRFAARHPFLVFGLMPLPAILCMLIMLVFGCGLLSDRLYIMSEAVSLPYLNSLASLYALLCRLLPFAIAAVIFTRTYVRSRVSKRWYVTAAAQVLVFAALFHCRIIIGDAPGQLEMLAMKMKIGVGLPLSLKVLLIAVLQVAVPLAIGTMMISVARRQRSDMLSC